MGVVWRAHDELLRRDVAVKELHVRVGVDDDFQIRQVLREARAAARLRHPDVVVVHDVVVDDGRPLIVMELVEGPSLADLVRQEGPLPEQRVAEIGVRVLAALAAAHAQGVVHRDVKPANILLAGDRVVLTDFGIAAFTSDTTLTSSVLGSPEYLAPERINGEVATSASDLWSLGVTLCAALRGESPFHRSDTQSTLAAVLTYEPPPIPKADRLWPVLAMLLRKDPLRRPTAAAAGALLAAAADLPAAPFDSATTPVVEPAGGQAAGRRTRRRLAVLLAVFVLVVAGTVWFVVRAGDGVADGTETRATPTVSAPAGFTGHRGEGFTIAVPSGWFRDYSSEHEITWVRDRRDPRTVLAHVEWWDDGGPGDARELLSEFEDGEFTMDVISNYHRIRLVDTFAPAGMTAAELEVTYHVSVEGEFDNHEVIRALVTDDGRTFILTVAAESDTPAGAEELWQASLDEVTTIMDSFRVTEH